MINPPATKPRSTHGWITKTQGGKGNFEIIFEDGTLHRGRLKKKLNAHWKKDPRRLTVGRVVLVEGADVDPALIVSILTPEEALRYGPAPNPPDEDLVLI